MTFFPEDIIKSATDVLSAARAKTRKIVTAESCTGGLIIAALTEIPGSSDVVERGFVAYSNISKLESLYVPADLLREYGAVSAEVVRAMVLGGTLQAHAHISVAVTGVAGPDGGTADKPVGLVHLASMCKGGQPTLLEKRFGDIGRTEIRLETVRCALEMLRVEIESTHSGL